MTYSYFHPEEEFQVWVLEEYADEHPGTRYCVEFNDGESYICQFFAAFDSENSGELEIDTDDPRYDEFHVVTYSIRDTIQSGRRRYADNLSVDYRDFPTKVTDLGTGTVVYPEKEAPTDPKF